MFQRKIDEIFKDLPNVFDIADDILVLGYDTDDMMRKVWKICRLKHKIKIRKLNFSLTESILLGTQAFASPPDMASSCVWENIILTKTPTFEGVCIMLYFIIFLEFFAKCLKFVDRWKVNFFVIDRW